MLPRRDRAGEGSWGTVDAGLLPTGVSSETDQHAGVIDGPRSSVRLPPGHGLDPTQRFAAAYHEAGHAIVAIAAGVPVISLAIRDPTPEPERPRQPDGMVRFGAATGVLPSRWIAILLAGWEAEHLAGFRLWHPLLPNPDWLQARRIALAAGIGPFQAEAVLAAQRHGIRSWLAIPTVWREVARLAERLLEEGLIRGAAWLQEQDRLAVLLPPLPGQPGTRGAAPRGRGRGRAASLGERLGEEAMEILGPALPLALLVALSWLARLFQAA